MQFSLIGPNHWVLYKDAAFSGSQDYYSLCPGEYQATTSFDDNSINSLKRGCESYIFMYI